MNVDQTWQTWARGDPLGDPDLALAEVCALWVLLLLLLLLLFIIIIIIIIIIPRGNVFGVVCL